MFDWTKFPVQRGTMHSAFRGRVWFGFYWPWLWHWPKRAPWVFREYKNCTAIHLPGLSVYLLKVA